MRATRLITVSSAVLLVLSGCSDGIAERLVEEAAEAAGAGEVDIDTDNGSVSVQSSEGSFNIGSQDVPEELPDQLPLPDGISVMGSMAQDGADGTTVGLQAGYDGTFEDAVAFFDGELESNGWTVTNTATTTAGDLRSATYEIEGFGFSGVVGVTQLGQEADAQNMLTVNLRSEAQG